MRANNSVMDTLLEANYWQIIAPLMSDIIMNTTPGKTVPNVLMVGGIRGSAVVATVAVGVVTKAKGLNHHIIDSSNKITLK